MLLFVVALNAPTTDARDTASAPGNKPAPADVHGSAALGVGTTTLGEGFPAEFVGDHIFVALSAYTLANGSAHGTFMITHRKPDGDLFVDLRGNVNCLAITGKDAILTGDITYANTPGLPGGEIHEGMVAGFIIHDMSGGDYMGWTFGDAAPDCSELPSAPGVPVEQGGFIVLD
jgi:hypothetical protein